MAIPRRLKRSLLALAAVLGIVLWFFALLLFTRVTENSDDFARLQNWILTINSVGIGVLLLLIVVNLTQLIRDYRRQVPGSRLRARMVTLLVMVAVTPLVGVYIFSVEFINRGIDNWFSFDMERGLNKAFELSQTALDTEKHARVSDLERIAQSPASHFVGAQSN